MAQLMNSIQGTYERCQAENIGLSKNLLRNLIKSDTIPCVRVGKNQVLINYDVLMEYLNTGTVQSTKQKEYGVIRPVPEKITEMR